MSDLVVIEPGQFWRWCRTTWLFDAVTDRRRNYVASIAGKLSCTLDELETQDYKLVHRGDYFVVIFTDDPGPAQVSPAQFQLPKRVHVVLLESVSSGSIKVISTTLSSSDTCNALVTRCSTIRFCLRHP